MPSATPKDLDKLAAQVAKDTARGGDATKKQLDPERVKAQRVHNLSKAVSDGKLPTTRQMVDAIDHVVDNNVLAKSSTDLSAESRHTLANVEQLLATVRDVLADKMPNNELQKAIWYSKAATSTLTDEDMTLDADLRELVLRAKDEARATLQHLAGLARLVATSSEFRTLLGDLSDILANALRSSIEEGDSQMAQKALDAFDSQRELLGEIRQGGPKTTSTVAPTMATSVDAVSTQSVKSIPISEGYPASEGYPSSTVATAYSQLYVPPGSMAPSTGRQTAHELVDRTANAMNTMVAPETQEVAEEVAQKADKHLEAVRSGNKTVGQAAQDATNEMVEGVRGALGALQLSDEARLDLRERFKAALSSIESRPDFRAGVENLFAVLSSFWELSGRAMYELKARSRHTYDRIQGELREARVNIQALLENCAQHKSLDPFLAAVRDLRKAVSGDDVVRTYLERVRDLVRACLTDEAYVASSAVSADFDQLVDQTSRLASGRYEDEMQRVADTAAEFMTALQNDDVMSAMALHTESLVRGLVLDDEGRPTIKIDLLRDLASALPQLAQRLGYLPLPRIEFEDEDYHFVLDNVVIKCTNILPKYVEIATDTVLDASDAAASEGKRPLRQALGFRISHVYASARDIAFYYKKKSGLVHPSDVGLVDFDITSGKGVSLRVLLQPDVLAAPGESVLVRRHVDAEIDSLRLRTHRTGHDLIYRMLTPIVRSKVRRRIEESITAVVSDLLLTLDQSIAMQTAKAAAKAEARNTTITDHGVVQGGAKPQATAKAQTLPSWSSRAYEVEP